MDFTYQYMYETAEFYTEIFLAVQSTSISGETQVLDLESEWYVYLWFIIQSVQFCFTKLLNMYMYISTVVTQ